MLLANETGSFEAPNVIARDNQGPLFVDHFDDDSRLDVLSFAGYAAYVHHPADPIFAEHALEVVGVASQSKMGDVNGDGWPDLVSPRYAPLPNDKYFDVSLRLCVR